MNVHTFGDRRDEENNREGQNMGYFGSNRQPLVGQRGTNNNQGGNNMGQGLLGQMTGFNGDPREETFLQMIVINFCPLAAFKSFITYFSIFITLIFIIQLSVGKTNIFDN